MGEKLIRIEPDYAVPPGVTLLEALEEAGLTLGDLAGRTGLSAERVDLLAKGREALTADVAVKLESVLGISSLFWNAREANYRARLARLSERQTTAGDIDWLGRLPWRELRRRGHLPQSDDKATLIAEAKNFFGVASVAEWCAICAQPAASFRLSTAHEVNQCALASWVRITETKAAAAQCDVYSESKFREVLGEVRSRSADPLEEVCAWLTSACGSVGVAIVFEPEIKGARVSGAAYWQADKPVIALSLRYRRDDQFWFSLFHEAAHILLHPRRERFIDSGVQPKCQSKGGEEDVSIEYEAEADRFAATTLIPEEYTKRLMTLRTLTEIEAFAGELGIAAGIVVGRLQHEGRLRYRVGNRLKRKIDFVDDGRSWS